MHAGLSLDCDAALHLDLQNTAHSTQSIHVVRGKRQLWILLCCVVSALPELRW
jgi:hypothetical protein